MASEFVQPGCLVFDVGANHGIYTEMYLELGARVVALEPNRQLADFIRRKLPKAQVEFVAVGAHEGEAFLNLGAGDGDSTLSETYAEILERDLRVKLHRVSVPVTTVDALANRFGSPDFVKIDVEGFEVEVIRGMRSVRPVALSFEYHGALRQELTECLDSLEGYEFRLAPGMGTVWSTPWCARDEILAAVDDIARSNPKAFGDVYARR
jgi:FkbM family methyltransferase